MQTLPPAAAAAWLDTTDGISRGLNHALSNRVNTLNTLLAVLQESRELDPEIEGALTGEEQRFEALLRLYRLMPLEGVSTSEPMVLTDPVQDAVALFAHHLELRMLPCTVTGLDGAPPVRSRRQALTQAILVMLVAVGRALVPAEDTLGLELGITFTEDEVFLRASARQPSVAVDASAWVAFEWLASTLGAAASSGQGDDGHAWAMLALPTLLAERKKGR